MSFSLDDPPNSRLFVVAGRNTSVSEPVRPPDCTHAAIWRPPPRPHLPAPLAQAEFLRSVFEHYGPVVFTKYLKDKASLGGAWAPSQRPGRLCAAAAGAVGTLDPQGPATSGAAAAARSAGA